METINENIKEEFEDNGDNVGIVVYDNISEPQEQMEKTKKPRTHSEKTTAFKKLFIICYFLNIYSRRYISNYPATTTSQACFFFLSPRVASQKTAATRDRKRKTIKATTQPIYAILGVNAPSDLSCINP